MIIPFQFLHCVFAKSKSDFARTLEYKIEKAHKSCPRSGDAKLAPKSSLLFCLTYTFTSSGSRRL